MSMFTSPLRSPPAGNFWQMGWSTYGLFWAHRYHLELNCTLEAMTMSTSPLSVSPDLYQQETSDRCGGAHMGFSEHLDTILNWTELYTRSNEHVHLTSECPTRSPPAGQRRSGRHSCAQPRQRQGSSDPARSCCPTQSSPACPCKEICQYFSLLLLRWISLSTLTV